MITLILASNYAQTQLVDGSLQVISKKQRLKNGFKKFGLFFGIALACIFIPVFHFILVPGFLIISIFAFFKGYANKIKVVINGECLCLSCKKPLVFDKFINEDRRMKCKNCFSHYLIKEDSK